MPRVRKVLPLAHQVTIDEWLKSQEELFPDGPPPPPPPPYTQPFRIKARDSAPSFLPAVDAVDHSVQSQAAQVIPAFGVKKMSG